MLIASILGEGPRVVVSTAAFHARVRGSLTGLGGLKETKNVSSPFIRKKISIVGSLRDREVVCLASDLWRAVSSHSSHHPQEVLPALFSLYVHKSGRKPDSFHSISSPKLSTNVFNHRFRLDSVFNFFISTLNARI